MQVGVRHEVSALSENVEKAFTKDCAVSSLAAEELSVVMVLIMYRYS
jgi:hypothetical protein